MRGLGLNIPIYRGVNFGKCGLMHDNIIAIYNVTTFTRQCTTARVTNKCEPTIMHVYFCMYYTIFINSIQTVYMSVNEH